MITIKVRGVKEGARLSSKESPLAMLFYRRLTSTIGSKEMMLFQHRAEQLQPLYKRVEKLKFLYSAPEGDYYSGEGFARERPQVTKADIRGKRSKPWREDER